MIVKCQQQCILKIRDGVPGHGPQEVLRRYKGQGDKDRVALACGCSLPVSWLPKTERDAVLELPCKIPRRLA